MKVMLYFHQILLFWIMRGIVQLTCVFSISFASFIFKINADTIMFVVTLQLTLIQISNL